MSAHARTYAPDDLCWTCEGEGKVRVMGRGYDFITTCLDCDGSGVDPLFDPASLVPTIVRPNEDGGYHLEAAE